MKKLQIIFLLFLWGCSTEEVQPEVKELEDVVFIESNDKEESELVNTLEEDTYTLGDMVFFNDFELIFRSTEIKTVQNKYSDVKKAVLVEYIITNNGDRRKYLSFLYTDCYDSEGKELLDVGSLLEESSTYEYIQPGATSTGYLAYEYTNDGYYRLELDDYEEVVDVYIPAEKDYKHEVDVERSNEYKRELTDEDITIGEEFEFAGLVMKLHSYQVEDIESSYWHNEHVVVLMDITNTNVEDFKNGWFLFRAYSYFGIEVAETGLYLDKSRQFDTVKQGETVTAEIAFEYIGDGLYLLDFDNLLENVEVLIEVKK